MNMQAGAAEGKPGAGGGDTFKDSLSWGGVYNYLIREGGPIRKNVTSGKHPTLFPEQGG